MKSKKAHIVVCILLALGTIASLGGAFLVTSLDGFGNPYGTSTSSDDPLYTLWFIIPVAAWIVYLTIYYLRRRR